MEKIINKININPYWIFFLSIYSIKDLLKLDNMQTLEFYKHYDWFGLFINLFIITLLYFLLKKYNRIKQEQQKYKEEITAFSVISHIRNKRRFIDSYSNIEYYPSPTETEEEFKKRLPEYGLFLEEWRNEYRATKAALQNGFMKNKTTIEIDEILSKWYPFINNKKLVK